MLYDLCKSARKSKGLARELSQVLKEASLVRVEELSSSSKWLVFEFELDKVNYTGFYNPWDLNAAFNNLIPYHIFELFSSEYRDTPVLSGEVKVNLKRPGKAGDRKALEAKIEASIKKDFIDSIHLPFKKGEILFARFVHGMTIYQFYRVLRCSASRVWLQGLEKENLWYKDDDTMMPMVAPTRMLDGDPIQKGFSKEDASERRVRVEGRTYARPWDGNPRLERHDD